MTRAALAAKAGISGIELQEVEADTCRPRFPTLEKLVGALGISFEQLSAWVPKWPEEGLQAVLEGVVKEMVADGEAEVRQGPNGPEYWMLPPQNRVQGL
jgi:transcriptional regulator with XRE-family HTH domain